MHNLILKWSSNELELSDAGDTDCEITIETPGDFARTYLTLEDQRKLHHWLTLRLQQFDSNADIDDGA